MMTRISALLAALALTCAAPAYAGDAAAGKDKAAACVACHNADGNSSNPAYPKLAGQYENYLDKALKDYRDGERANAIMKGMAASLSDEDIANLSAWFASQSSELHVLNH
jgi:cytochrome c553